MCSAALSVGSLSPNCRSDGSHIIHQLCLSCAEHPQTADVFET